MKKIFERWQKNLWKICLYAALIIFAVEVIVYIVYCILDTIFYPVHIYLLRFLIVPSIVNFTAVFSVRKIVLGRNYTEKQRSYASVLMVCILCSCVQCTHYVFAPLMGCFCIAIFVSTIYGEKKLTQMSLGAGVISLLISFIIAKLELRRNDSDLYYDVVVSLILLLAAYMISLAMISYQKERTKEITKSYATQNILSEKLKRDALTKLYNNEAFFELLEHHCEESRANNKVMYLAVLDLDDFKKVNDTYGHLNGNKVLLFLAELLSANVPQNAYAARYGGEEFAVLFPGFTEQQAVGYMENIRKFLAKNKFDFLKDEFITFSCGITKFRPSRQTNSQFFEAADKAMYISKAEGKNKITVN